MAPGRRAIGGLAVLLLLSACGIEQRHRRQLAGSLTSAELGCPAMTGSLVVQKDDVAFSPSEGTWVLSGKVTSDRVQAARSRPSFDGKTYATSLEGVLRPDGFTGTYRTPTCTYAVDLKRL